VRNFTLVGLKRRSGGFSLLELIAVMVLIGILGSTAVTQIIPSASMQLQSSRDRVLSGLFAAQQLALVQDDAVRFVVSGGNQINILRDTDGDSSFSDESGAYVGGTQYPITLLPNQSFASGATIDFDSLGQTSGAALNLSQDGGSVAITVTATGYSY